MGITDRISARFKKAAGDVADSDRLRREGAAEERRADAKDELLREEERALQAREAADRRAAEVERLERGT